LTQKVDFVRSALEAGVPVENVLLWGAVKYGWAAMQIDGGYWLVFKRKENG